MLCFWPRNQRSDLSFLGRHDFKKMCWMLSLCVCVRVCLLLPHQCGHKHLLNRLLIIKTTWGLFFFWMETDNFKLWQYSNTQWWMGPFKQSHGHIASFYFLPARKLTSSRILFQYRFNRRVKQHVQLVMKPVLGILINVSWWTIKHVCSSWVKKKFCSKNTPWQYAEPSRKIQNILVRFSRLQWTKNWISPKIADVAMISWNCSQAPVLFFTCQIRSEVILLHRLFLSWVSLRWICICTFVLVLRLCCGRSDVVLMLQFEALLNMNPRGNESKLRTKCNSQSTPRTYSTVTGPREIIKLQDVKTKQHIPGSWHRLVVL